VPGPHDYRLFGLRLRSELELPELVADPFSDDPDITIQLGTVGLGDGRESSADESYFFSVPDVARYRISGGSGIVVDPDAHAPIRNVRLFLLGSAMGILLHQRGHLPLHANAVEVDGRAVAFMGRSGAGKSTLAAWFHDRGHRILADDVCVVHFDEQGASASPGLSRLRLWEDALAAIGREDTDYERSYAGDEEYRKYDVPISAKAGGEGLPLAAIYLLDRGDSLAITALHGTDAVDAVFANTYRGALVHSTGKSQTHWEACLRLVREVPIFSLRRPWGHDRMSDQIEGVLAHARSSIVPLQE